MTGKYELFKKFKEMLFLQIASKLTKIWLKKDDYDILNDPKNQQAKKTVQLENTIKNYKLY